MKETFRGDEKQPEHQDAGFRLLKALCLVLMIFPGGLWAAEPSESPVPDAYVARAQFTTDIVDREPVDQIVSVDESQQSIYFFTDLRHLQGRTVTHRWEFEGQLMQEIKFEVGGPRWRVYSKRTLDPGVTGKWTVLVLDQSGWPLHASIFMQGTPTSTPAPKE